MLALLVVLLGVLLPAGLFVRSRRRRGTKLVEKYVTVRPVPGPDAVFDTRPSDGPDRDHVLAVIPVEISRSTTVEEVRS